MLELLLPAGPGRERQVVAVFEERQRTHAEPRAGCEVSVAMIGDHLRRHSFGSGLQNVSKFLRGMGHIEIKGLIREATRTGTAWRVEGNSRVLEVGLGRVIGTDPLGRATSGIRVVTTELADVVSAYPIPWP